MIKMTVEKQTKKLKLLIATDSFLPRWDGIARFLNEMIPRLLSQYDITVIAPKFGKYDAQGFNLIQIPLSKLRLGDYTTAKLKAGLIKKEVKKADIVFTQTIGPIGTLTLTYAKRNRIPSAAFVHCIEWELVPMASKNGILRQISYPITKFLTRAIYNKANLIIVPSESISEVMTWERIYPKKQVVHLGVDCTLFKPLTERTEKEQQEIIKMKEALNLNNNFIIGNHGRIAHEKDLYTLMRAFIRFKKTYDDSRLVIIGEGVEEIKQKLRGVPGIILLGAQNNVQNYLNMFDVYVTSSLTETTSLATLEAMASGLPVISTPVGFIKEYIHDNNNGLIYNQKNTYALYQKLDLLKKNNSLTKILGGRARKTVLKEFTWEHTAQGIEDALSSLENL